MAEQDSATNGGASEAPKSPETEARLLIHRHYIKDFSFENPNAPTIYTSQQTPTIKVQIDVNVSRLAERVFETVLAIKVIATVEDKSAFQVELEFAGLSKVGDNVDQSEFEHILGVEVPHLLFPFARNIVADVTRDGGYPPLLINPVDFAGLRQQRAAETSAAGEGATATA
ncbi:MAG: protein-export chaperone SecB [Kiloniellales bacterium]|nr:protein-export chaperone SecB [Kiloniellales bacterium]